MEKKPWSPASDGGMELVKDTSLHDKLIDNWTLFTSSLEIDPLWPKMIEYKVVTIQKKEDIQHNGRRPRIDQVQDLLVHLTLGPVWRLLAFFKVLILTGNTHLLHPLGVNEDEYAENSMTKRVGILHCPNCLDIYEKPYRLVACTHQLCVKCLTDIKSAEGGQSIAITCPLPTCGTVSNIQGEDKENLKMHIDENLDNICLYLRSYSSQTGHLVKCVDCEGKFSATNIIHECKQCNGKLCGQCYCEHESLFPDHATHHQHANAICCRHGKKSLEFCYEEKMYICNQCVRHHCRCHDRSKFTVNAYEELIDICQKLAANELQGPNLGSCKEELLTIIQKTEDQLIREVKDWGQRQRNIINSTAMDEQEKQEGERQEGEEQKAEGQEFGESFLDLKDFIPLIPENTIAAMKESVLKYADIDPCRFLNEFSLPELNFVDANLESFRQGLEKWTEAYDAYDQADENCDTPPFHLPPLPSEIQETFTAPTKGNLIWNSLGSVFCDIAWFNDGSLMAGDYHGKAVWRISFSPDYRNITTETKLHEGTQTHRVSTSPEGGWAFSDWDGALYICDPGEEEATIWVPGFRVWQVILSQDRIILSSQRTIHVYNKNRDFLFKKKISSEVIQFMSYNRQTNTMVFTAGRQRDPSYLYVTCLITGSPVYRIRRFSDDRKKLKFPVGLCTDQSCNIYVADHEANAIFVFDRVGRFLHELKLDKPHLLTPWTLCILEQPDKPPILAVKVKGDTIYLYELS